METKVGEITEGSCRQGRIIFYPAGEKVDGSELVELGPPANLGGTVLAGDPRISARIDYAQGGLLGGVFQATPGRVRIEFPFTEHAAILDGEVDLTDQWGNHARLGAGDSYLVRQGSVLLWEVRGQPLQKTFFNRTMESGSPAPMVIYRAGVEVAQSDMADFGPPEGLGGTVLSDDPNLSGRIDYRDDVAIAGVFQATDGDAQIHFPFTEHATIMKGAVTLKDEAGDTRRLGPGDSYMITQESMIFWHVAGGRIQKSFFNVVER